MLQLFPMNRTLLGVAFLLTATLAPLTRAQLDRSSGSAASVRVEVRVQIDASPDTVWRTLTNPKLVKQWHLGADTETDWQVGSRLVRTGVVNKKNYEAKGVVVANERPKRLVHTQWNTESGLPDRPQNYRTIRYELAEVGDGTELTIIEENILGEEQRSLAEAHWQKVVRGLKAIAERRRSSD